MRLELTRANAHYPLKVARLPIPPSGHQSEKRDSNPRPQPWQGCALPTELFSQSAVPGINISNYSSEKRDSNPRPQPWQGCALPTELFSQSFYRFAVAKIKCFFGLHKILSANFIYFEKFYRSDKIRINNFARKSHGVPKVCR